MRQVLVVLDDPIKPYIEHDVIVGSKLERITWNFRTTDPAVQQVKITFNNPSATFFGNSNTFTRNVQQGRSHIYGHVPTIGAGAPTSQKYTVEGLDGSGAPIMQAGNQVHVIDPCVIVDEP